MPDSATLITVIILGVIAVIFAFLFLLGGWMQRDPSRFASMMKDPVEGTLVLTATPAMIPESTFSMVTGMLSAEGVAPHAVQKKVAIPIEQWPAAGQSLPILIERARPSIWLVQWHLVPNRDADALAEAERLAAAASAGDLRPPSEPD